MLRDLRDSLDRLEHQTSPFDDEYLNGKTEHWVTRKLVGEVAFTEYTSDGRLRHPRLESFRPRGNVRPEARNSAR